MEIENQDLAASGRSSSTDKLEVYLKEEHDLKLFSYASIIEATNDFSSENKLGQGGFGVVYKVILFLLYSCCGVKFDMKCYIY